MTDSDVNGRKPFAPTGTLLDFCSRIYAAMEVDAINTVWSGKTTLLFETLQIPLSYYPKVMRQLSGAGCIEQVERGTRYRPSIWKLWHPPSPDDMGGKSASISLTGRAGADTMPSVAKRVASLENQLKGLNVVTALAELADRLDALDKRLQAIENG